MEKLPVHWPKCLTLQERKTTVRQDVEIDYYRNAKEYGLIMGNLLPFSILTEKA